MTTLTILPNYDKKKIKCFGTIAAGEHVAVTVTDGAQWLGSGSALRLRVLFGPTTVGVFPAADADEWSATGTQDADAYCELNLNTVQAEKLLKFGGACLFILDDIENHTLYATGEFDVLPWPKRRGMDEPIDLDGYPQLIEDMEDLKEAWAAYQATINAALDGKAAAVHTHTVAAITDLLDGGKIKSDLLPSYVDDVVEYASVSAFPATGESGKIYVAKDTNKTYRWSGSEYVQIGGDTPPVTSVNGKTGAVVLSASDVGAVPTSRTVNGKALSSNVTIGPSDIAAEDPETYGSLAAQIDAIDSLADSAAGMATAAIEKFPIDTPTENHLAAFDSNGGLVDSGKSAADFCGANDPRLTNARTPTAHASTHASGGSDPITPASIGAASTADLRYSLNTATVTPGSSVWTSNYSQIYDRYGELVDVNLPEWGTYSTSEGDKTGWFWHNPDMVYDLLSEDESATSLTANWEGYNGEELVSYTINFSKTTSPATVTNVKDRAINAVALSGNATLTPPSQVSGKSRDFYLSVSNSGSSNATITVSRAVLVDSAMNAVTLVAKPSAITTWRLTEMINSLGSLIPATFIVTGANQLSSSDVIDPATATASGQAADALATKNALAGKQAALGYTPADQSQIASDYLSNSAYAVGDLVFKDGVLYVCNTAIASPGETWTLAHWTAQTVAETFDDIADGLDEVIGGMGTLPVIYSVDGALSSSSTNPVQNRVITAALSGYAFHAATVSSGTTPTVTDLANRAINTATLGSTVTAATVTLPAATTGRSRDFYIDLIIEAADAPTLTFIDPATGTTANVAFGADSLADIAPGYNLVLWTELPNNRWLVSVKHEEASS